MASEELFEIMHSTRSMRRLKKDPISDQTIYKILDSGIRAPSGGNTQHWRFLVVQDPEVKRQVQEIYQKGWEEARAIYDGKPGPKHMEQKQFSKLLDSATYLAENLAEAPVLLFACLKDRPMPQGTGGRSLAERLSRLSGSSIFPAVQNILLACRAMGLGATLTTVCSLHEEELRPVLNLPENISTYALIPIGYPMGKFGPVRRIPVEEITCLNQWGNRLARPTG